MILEYIVTGNEMKLLDDTTSQVFLVPSVVLMEQAAARGLRGVGRFGCGGVGLLRCYKGSIVSF